MATQVEEMMERQEPRLMSFAVSDCVEGILMSIERVMIADRTNGQKKPVVRYIVDQGNGDVVFFWGAYQLDMKLRPSDQGHYISVRCEGEDVTVNRNGNNMKVFKVLVSKHLAKDNALYITDSDIAF